MGKPTGFLEYARKEGPVRIAGERIKDLNRIKVSENEFFIELNKGTRADGKYDIHIQNKHFRLNLSEQDFCKIVCCIMYANENLKHYKR